MNKFEKQLKKKPLDLDTRLIYSDYLREQNNYKELDKQNSLIQFIKSINIISDGNGLHELAQIINGLKIHANKINEFCGTRALASVDNSLITNDFFMRHIGDREHILIFSYFARVANLRSVSYWKEDSCFQFLYEEGNYSTTWATYRYMLHSNKWMRQRYANFNSGPSFVEVEKPIHKKRIESWMHQLKIGLLKFYEGYVLHEQI